MRIAAPNDEDFDEVENVPRPTSAFSGANKDEDNQKPICDNNDSHLLSNKGKRHTKTSGTFSGANRKNEDKDRNNNKEAKDEDDDQNNRKAKDKDEDNQDPICNNNDSYLLSSKNDRDKRETKEGDHNTSQTQSGFSDLFAPP